MLLKSVISINILFSLKNLLNKYYKKFYPLITAMFIFCIVITVTAFISVGNNGGHFVYALDDPYIHMAMAKNFVMHGVWGITPAEFTSSSSSPLWTLLLSGVYFITGVNEIAPFVLNIIFASLTIFAAFLFLKKYINNNIIITGVLLAVVFCGALTQVVFTGLEHTLQAFLTVLAFYFFSEIVELFWENKTPMRKDYIFLYITLAALSAVRYEGLFVSFAVIFVLAYRRKYTAALLTLFSAALPAVVMGIISVSKGWFFLPNPVLLKGAGMQTGFVSLLSSVFSFRFAVNLWDYYHVLLIIVLLLIFFFLLRAEKNLRVLFPMIFILITAALLHAQFAKFGSLLRYDLYIIIPGILLTVISAVKYFSVYSQKFRIPVIVVLAVSLIPFGFISIRGVRNIPRAASNIYNMQYQTAQFVKEYYNDNIIALNDIGAVAFYTDARCIDLWGIASLEVATAIQEGKYNTDKINEVAVMPNAKIAIVFEKWFDKYGGLPQRWKKAGEWTIPDNIVCGDERVSIYAVDKFNYNKLLRALNAFSEKLPQSVKQSGEYLKPPPPIKTDPHQ